MITYQMTSPKTGAEYQFKFDHSSRIVGFEILGENTFSPEHTKILFSQVPDNVVALKKFAEQNKIQLVEIIQDLSFDAFWKKYGNTAGSRIRAEAIWKKMSDKQKALALGYISRYKQSLGSTTQANGTTYLNGQYWIK